MRHAVDELAQVRAELHGADLALQALQLALGDAHQLEFLRHGRVEVGTAGGQRVLDEADQLLRGLGHRHARRFQRRHLALVAAEAALADDRPRVAHPRAAGEDVLGADAGQPGDHRLGIVGFADVAGGLLLVVAAHLAVEDHQRGVLVVADQLQQVLEVGAREPVAADAHHDARAAAERVEDFGGQREAHAAALGEDGDFAGVEHARVVAADGADFDAVDAG